VQIFHFDLYRLVNGEELEYLGIRDYFAPQHVCLVEWPQRGSGFLPMADLTIAIETPKMLAAKGDKKIPMQCSGRLVQITAHTERGQLVLQNLKVIENP
jgi:tRNA threonylcarbamoyladenosine biosynthesis protein TsaE